jgi:hypothetical protein
MSLNDYIDPDAYHPEAVAEAAKGEIASLQPRLLIVRLGMALRDDNLIEADAAVARLEGHGLVGYALFQFSTARMILAYRRADQSAFYTALALWLGCRRQYPGNWINSVLQEPEFATWLAGVDPQELEPPPPAVPKELTEEDRAYVRDFETVRRAAINENLQWLREMGLTETVDELAQTYTLSFVNRDLREVTICRQDDTPCIILAFDGEDNYLGSFLAH